MATYKVRLKAGQVVRRDRNKPIKDADGNPTGRFEQVVINKGQVFESERDLAALEPDRYEAVGGSAVADARKIADLERELAEAKAKLAAVTPQTVIDNPSFAPGGQVSSGFQADGGPASPETVAKILEQTGGKVAGEPKADADKPAAPKPRDIEASYGGNLESKTVAELRDIAAAEEVEIPAHANKAEIVKALKAAK